MAEVTLASRLAAIEESVTLALNARAKQMAAEGRSVYNLTAGELASDTPGYIQTAVAKQLANNKYTPVAGLPELREAIAVHAANFYGLSWISDKNVVVTGGAKPAIFASFLALLNDGDEVIVPVPGWTTSYTPLVGMAGGQVIEVPLNANFDLDVKAISKALSPRTKMIILNSPNNPTGAVFSAGALSSLAQLLKDKPITILADDIYSKLVYQKDIALVPASGFDSLVIINGFSKSQALTGWRIGYLIADETVAKAAIRLLSHITGNASLPAQYAAIEAMKHNDQPPRETIEALKLRRQLVLDSLKKAGIKYIEPSGAFYILLDVRGMAKSSTEWCEKLLLQTGVALVPGEAFSAPGYARLTFVADEKVLKAALEQLTRFVGMP